MHRIGDWLGFVRSPDGTATHSIRLQLTQEHIGDTLGLTNVHVSRMLKQLKIDGLIDCQQRRLALLDEARLTDIAEFDANAITGY